MLYGLEQKYCEMNLFPESSCLEMFVDGLAHDEMFPRHFVVRGPEKSPYEGRREYFHLNENLILKGFFIYYTPIVCAYFFFFCN